MRELTPEEQARVDEAMELAVQELQNHYPGMTINEGPPDDEEGEERFLTWQRELLEALGTCLDNNECFDCGATFKDEEVTTDDEGYHVLPSGWESIHDARSGQLIQFMCPKCYAVMQEHSAKTSKGGCVQPVDGVQMLKDYKARKAAVN